MHERSEVLVDYSSYCVRRLGGADGTTSDHETVWRTAVAGASYSTSAPFPCAQVTLLDETIFSILCTHPVVFNCSTRIYATG